jgi:hypothetical protein
MKNSISKIYAQTLIVLSCAIMTVLPYSAEAGVVSRVGLSTSNAQVTSYKSLVGTTTPDAYWTFDGNTMINNVADVSGNARHGALLGFGATSTAQRRGAVGQALYFNGVASRVTVPDFIGTGDLTVCVWIYPESFWSGTNRTARILDNGNFNFYIQDANFTAESFRASSNNGVSIVDSGANTTTLFQWHHGCVRRADSTDNIFYVVDGVNSGTPNNGGTPAAGTTALFIGNRSALDRGFTGIIDDLRIYKRFLSLEEIQAIYLTTRPNYVNVSHPILRQSEMVGYWSFNGPDMIGRVLDRSGQGNSGYLLNFATSTAVRAGGKVGQALLFDGVDDNILLNDTNDHANITLSAWVKPTTQKTGMKIISKKMSGASSQYGLATHDSSSDKFTATFYSSGVSSDVCDSTGTDGSYTAGEWYHVAATYNGSTCAIYVNGVDVTTVSSDTASGDINNTSSALRIGAEGGSSPGSYFSGVIDEVQIFNRALSATEVKSLYNAAR